MLHDIIFPTWISAGKDRTGILAAILLKVFASPYLHDRFLNFLELAGVDDATVSEEYALSRIGREPAREMSMKRLSKEPIFASNNEAALNMFTCR
jgi:hypothetical protein